VFHLETEPQRHHPRRDAGDAAEARLHVLVDLDPLLVLADLLARQPPDVVRVAELVEEELQLRHVPELEVLVGRRGQPGTDLPQPLLGEGVGAPAAAVLLAGGRQQSHALQPLRLGVEPSVREDPEVADRAVDGPLEVVGRGRAAQADHPEHHVGRGGQSLRRHVATLTI
jgi:hypothetical protein